MVKGTLHPWLEASDVVPMFPSLVWKLQVEPGRRDAMRERILAAIAELRSNFLSGVYYVRTHPGADTITFHDPRPQTAVIRPPVVELTAENTDQVVVRVRDGTLLLFPSWLAHSVDANTSDEERVSVSFNVMFSAFAERLGKPLW